MSSVNKQEKMESLPDDVLEIIINYGTEKCIDCENCVYYKVGVKTCKDCDLKACRAHSKSRFAFSETLCNNCHFWSNGLPAAAKGSTEW